MLQPVRRDRRRAGTPVGRRVGRLISPLDVAYQQAGIAPPVVRPVQEGDLPQPYRALLAHEGEMTRTLERHVGGRVGLRVLSTRARGRYYFRRVLLVEEGSGRPVAMGAIRLTLDALSRPIRAEIARGDVPLGRILRARGLDVVSRPTGFLAVTPNPELMGLFWMKAPDTLYGRLTDVFLRDRKIGDIVEILPPA